MFVSANDVTKAKYFLQYFLNIKQTSDMEFPNIHVYTSIWVGDGDELLDMGMDVDFPKHGLYCVSVVSIFPGDESITKQSSLI